MLKKGDINFSQVSRWVPQEYIDNLKDIRLPEINNILYTVTGSYGIPIIVKTDKKFCFQRHIAIIKPNHEAIDYNYLHIVLKSPFAMKQAHDTATGTAQKTVSLSSLRNFTIPLPSRAEQKQIIKKVEQFLTFADKIEKSLEKAQAKVNNLTQSILAKAFRGELTQQWRKQNPDLISGENSAQALLEKIKAEREKLIPKKKARKKQSQRKKSG